MPYIQETARQALQYNVPGNPGELNYEFTLIINRYLRHWGVSYQHINDVIGALECAKLELYRRVAADYENKKKEENGDVYSVV